MTKKKQKLSLLVSLAKNDPRPTKTSPLVSLAKNDQEKQKLSPLVTVTKNDQEKNKAFTVGILAQKCSKIRNFHCCYP